MNSSNTFHLERHNCLLAHETNPAFQFQINYFSINRSLPTISPQLSITPFSPPRWLFNRQALPQRSIVLRDNNATQITSLIYEKISFESPRSSLLVYPGIILFINSTFPFLPSSEKLCGNTNMARQYPINLVNCKTARTWDLHSSSTKVAIDSCIIKRHSGKNCGSNRENKTLNIPPKNTNLKF